MQLNIKSASTNGFINFTLTKSAYPNWKCNEKMI